MKRIPLGETHYIEEYQSAAKTWMVIAGATSGYNADLITLALSKLHPNTAYRNRVI